ncbi:MAG: acetaldehyde dehydrogenase, partial [Niameybacter sp.]
MELLDKDLVSIQEVRSLLKQAREAQKKLATLNQTQIDRIVKAIADAGLANAEKLAKMANEETGFGKWEDKIIKNKEILIDYLKNN